MPPVIAASGFTAIIAILSALAAVFYPGLRIFDDEWARALRAQSARAGYIALIVLLAAALLVALIRPHWIVAVLAWSLFVSAAAPVVTYAVLDWRASRNG